MATICWPGEMRRAANVKCALCAAFVDMAHATAGLRYATGEQAFACDDHARSRVWIDGWADFLARQVPQVDRTASPDWPRLLDGQRSENRRAADIFIELRNVPVGVPWSADVGRHLLTRHPLGATLIITDEPTGKLSSIRKAWLNVIRAVERQQASTLDDARQFALGQILQRIRSLSFVAATASSGADVQIAGRDRLHAVDRHFATVYLWCDATGEELASVGRLLMPHALLVAYPPAHPVTLAFSEREWFNDLGRVEVSEEALRGHIRQL